MRSQCPEIWWRFLFRELFGFQDTQILVKVFHENMVSSKETTCGFGVVSAGFWLVAEGFGWLTILAVTVANYIFFFCLTCLLFLVNLVPALTEHFLWKYNHAFSQCQLLCGYILPILWSFLMMGFCHLPGNRISFYKFRCIQKLLSMFEFCLSFFVSRR